MARVEIVIRESSRWEVHNRNNHRARLVNDDCRPELEAAFSLGQKLSSLAAISKCFTTATGSL